MHSVLIFFETVHQYTCTGTQSSHLKLGIFTDLISPKLANIFAIVLSKLQDFCMYSSSIVQNCSSDNPIFHCRAFVLLL